MNPILIGAGVLVLLILVGAAISVRRQNTSVLDERLERFTDFSSLQAFDLPAESNKPKEKEPSALAERLDSVLSKREFGKNWIIELARADLQLTVGEYFSLHILAAVGLGLFAYFILFPQQLVLAIIAGAVGIFIPRFYVSYKKGKRLVDFETQLPDILGLWVNSLRSGYSTMQSVEAIAKEAPQPSSKEFRRVVQEVQLGLEQEKALAHLQERMPSEDLDLVITAVNIQREVGGNLAEILEVISHTIRERIKLKGEVRVLTSQGRITGYIIGGLPIVLALFLGIVNPDYVGNLFKDHFCGWPMIAIGLGLIGTGTAVIQRIVDIEI